MNRRSFLSVLGIGILARKIPSPNAYVTTEEADEYYAGIATAEEARKLADNILIDLTQPSTFHAYFDGIVWYPE